MATNVAYAEAPPPSPLPALAKLGKQVHPSPQPSVPSCAAPTKSDVAALKKRVLAWIDQQTPDEQVADEPGLEFNACRSESGALVDVSQDRRKRKGDHFGTRRNYVLRVGDAIETIDARESTPQQSWMEWADEGRLRVIDELDLDGDGALDLVWSSFEHEGGAVATSDTIKVRFATGKQRDIVTVRDLVDVRVVGGQLVIAGTERSDLRPVYACVGTDLHVTRCPASTQLQRASERDLAAAALTTLNAVPDRDQVIDWLTTAGLTAPPKLLAALPAAQPVDKVKRGVAALLAARGLDVAFNEVFQQPRPEAVAFFDGIAAQLGDARCTPTPLTPPARAKLADWIAKQDKAPEDVVLTPECGMYVWVEWNHHDSSERNEVLVALDEPAPVKVASFKQPPPDGPRPAGHFYEGMFFQHGDTTVGVVIRDHNMTVIANDKVVAQSHGDITRYGFDARWSDFAVDVVVDSGTLFHPTPTGLEKLDRALIKDRETERHAIERLLADPPSSEPTYRNALRVLGADPELVALCKRL